MNAKMDDDVIQWKKEQRRHRLWRIVRWSIGMPLLFSYPWLGFIAPFLVVAGALLIAMDIAGYLAGIITSPLFPSPQGKRQPMYGIPESRAAKGLYAEAEQEYEKIIQEFPNEAKPHIDMIAIAVQRLNDAELAEQLYHRGMGLLKDCAARETLTAAYQRIRTRLKTREDMQIKTIPAAKLAEVKARLARDRRSLWREPPAWPR